MNIIYKVISINQQQQSFVVRYYSDVVTEDMLAVSVLDGNIQRDLTGSPIQCCTDYNLLFQHPEATDQEIHQYIMKCAPIKMLELRQKIIETGTIPSMKSIEKLFKKEVKFDPKELTRELTNEEIDKLIEQLQNA